MGIILFAPVSARAEGQGPPASGSQSSVSDHIYLYQPNGAPPVDVTDIYIPLGHVFDCYGNPLYIQVNWTAGTVTDLNGNLVGFTTTSS
jgi:hypothetical protein